MQTSTLSNFFLHMYTTFVIALPETWPRETRQIFWDSFKWCSVRCGSLPSWKNAAFGTFSSTEASPPRENSSIPAVRPTRTPASASPQVASSRGRGRWWRSAERPGEFANGRLVEISPHQQISPSRLPGSIKNG